MGIRFVEKKPTPTYGLEPVAASFGIELLPEQQIVAMAHPLPPSLCGVYFLLNGGNLVYVGQSVDIVHRVLEHKRCRWRSFDSYAYILCSKSELNLLESLYIHHYKPAGNGQFGMNEGQKHAPIPFKSLLKLAQALPATQSTALAGAGDGLV